MLQHTLIFLNIRKSMDVFSLLRYGKALNTAIYSNTWSKLQNSGFFLPHIQTQSYFITRQANKHILFSLNNLYDLNTDENIYIHI